MSKRGKTRSRRTEYLLAAVISVAVALFVLEIYSRKTFPDGLHVERWQEPYLGTGEETRMSATGGSPESQGYDRRLFQYTYRYDRDLTGMADRGTFLFRSRTQAAPPRPGVTRIFVLGGSVAWGAGASSESAMWWAVLERELREKLGDPGIFVIPAAATGQVTTQERLTAELFVFPLKPDAIVTIDGFNDLTSLWYGARPGDPFNQGISYARFESLGFHVFHVLGRWSSLARSLLWDAVHSELARNQKRVLEDPVARGHLTASTKAVFTDNVSRLASRCSQERVFCLFGLQPNLALTRLYMGDSEPPVTNINWMLTHVARELQGDLATTRWPEKAHPLDVTHLMDGRVGDYLDPVHLDDAGQRAMASAFADALLSERGKWYRRR